MLDIFQTVLQFIGSGGVILLAAMVAGCAWIVGEPQ